MTTEIAIITTAEPLRVVTSSLIEIDAIGSVSVATSGSVAPCCSSALIIRSSITIVPIVPETVPILT